MPELMQENFDALELWNQVNTQWRAGAMGVIGLDYAEVRIRAKELDIELNECIWRKIKVLEAKVLERQSGKEEWGMRKEKREMRKELKPISYFFIS